jgi:protein gp37
MNKTGIEYMDFSWNPIVMRCQPISAGCDNCWHLRMANRLAGNPKISDDERAAYAGEIPPLLVEDRLEKPLRRKKPARIGVQFMGDLFHDDVPDAFIFDVLAIIAKCPQHTFQILTKRPKRMAYLWRHAKEAAYPNLWLGVTIENQKAADERIPLLLQTPAAVRFVSCEPLLSEIDLEPYLQQWRCPNCRDWQHGSSFCDCCNTEQWENIGKAERRAISLVIVGGETGLGARPMHPDWARSLRDQCQANGTKYFFKQWGAWVDSVNMPQETIDEIMPVSASRTYQRDGWPEMYRVGKAHAGHHLDGVAWREMPAKYHQGARVAR